MTATLLCQCASGASLKATSLEPGLHAAVCPDCGCVLLQMDDWRRWRDQRKGSVAVGRTPEPVGGDAPTFAAATTPAEPGKARKCPACSRMMERLFVDAAGSFRVDRCGPCQYVWLDQGEWQALAQRGLAEQLDALLSDGSQRRLQNERLEATRWQTLRQRHGDACIDEVIRIRRWLAEQPQRNELLNLLRGNETLLP